MDSKERGTSWQQLYNSWLPWAATAAAAAVLHLGWKGASSNNSSSGSSDILPLQ